MMNQEKLMLSSEALIKITSNKNSLRGGKMAADSVFFWSNWLLLLALILGVIATYAIVVSGNIRDKELKHELAESNERTESLRKSNLILQENVERERMERLKLEAIVA